MDEPIDINPFKIQDLPVYDGVTTAEIRPCCGEDNVVDYAVWINKKLAFTITYDTTAGKWIVALKNADDEVADAMVQQIGQGIAAHYRNQ